MKLSLVLFISTILQVNAVSYGQNVSLEVNNASMEKVFKLLKAQTDYVFLSNYELLKESKPVTLSVKNTPLKSALELCFKGQPLAYTIDDKTIVVFKKDTPLPEQQDISVSGIVSDEKGKPIPGVSVKIKGTTNGVSTNINGRFSLNRVPENAVLVFSFIGFETQEVNVNNRSQLSITLKEDLKALQEVVVVGYGTQKKANLTGAVSTVDFADLENVPQSNTVNILSGRLPGVSVVQGGGQPGDDQGQVFIRGIGTLNDSSPLVIIDGAQASLTDLGNLTPQEIENVSVLKDASSAAIYGARGANGVILVTTKLPKSERIDINFSAYSALQKATYLPQMVESWQFMELMNEAVTTARYSKELIDSAKNGLFSDNIANTKWFDELFITAPMQNYSLNVSGKTKGTSFQLAGGFLNQDGIMRETNSKRYTIRGNVRTQIKNNITAGLNIWGYTRDSEEPYESPSDLIDAALHVPIMPVRYENGQYAVWNYNITGVKTVANPVLLSQMGFTNRNNLKINVQPSLEFKIITDLNFRSAFTYSFDNLTLDRFNPTYSFNNNYGEPAFENKSSTLRNANTGTRQTQWQNILTYNKQLNKKHMFNALLGHEISDYNETYFGATGNNLPNNDLTVLNNATANFLVNGEKQEWALQSFFGRISYSFNDKYLLEGNLRADGSSRFNGEYRYSPSASIGWVLSKEDFFKPLDPLVSFMKVRVGYGKLGNDRIGNYTYQQTLDLAPYYIVGGNLQTAASITSFGNPYITWEQTTTKNLGLDMGMFKNRININFDVYDRLTDGILFRLPLPLSFGDAKSPFQNIAKVSNKGYELNLEHINTVGKLTYRGGINFSYNKNNIEKLNGQRVIVGGENGGTNGGLTLLQEGSPMYSWFGYIADGLYKQEDEDNGYPKLSNAIVVGSLKFRDLNNDGSITDDDRTIIGDGSTPYTFGLTGGLSYKGLDFSFLGQGISDKDIYIYDYGNRPGNGGQINFWKEWYTKSYHPVRNPEGTWPIIKSQSPDASASSSHYVSNASYIRLKNVEIGYTLPKMLLQKVNISQMRLYVSGQNVLTFSSVPKNLDPERSNFQRFNRSYPQTSVYSIGFNANF